MHDSSSLSGRASSAAEPAAIAMVLTSGYYNGPSDPHVGDMDVLSATADGAIWIISARKLYLYSTSAGKFVPTSTWTAVISDSPMPLAAVNGSHAYFLTDQNGRIEIASYTAGAPGTTTALAPLPEGDVPTIVTAGADGTLWTIGGSGNIYAYDGATAQWTTIAQPPGELYLLSVGGAAAVYALVLTTSPQVYRYDDGSWTLVTITGPLDNPWIGACPDGSLWFTPSGDSITLRLPDGTQIAMPYPTYLQAEPVSAASRYACYLNVRSQSAPQTIGYIGYGVSEQPAQGWPAMNAGELAGYAAINARLGISDPDGVRGAYANLSAPLSDYYATVSGMAAPTGVSAADWSAVQTQIESELEYAQAVQNFFANMVTLNLEIATIQLAEYDRVVQMVGLPDNPDQQPQTLISIILGTLVSKLFDFAVSQAPDEVQKVITVGQSIYNFAANAEAKKNDAPDKDAALKLACAKLGGTLADLQAQAVDATASFESAILSDWGMLQACGLAITSDVWYWPPTFNPNVLDRAGAANALDFYQTLMPVKWQLMQLSTLVYAGRGINYPPYVPAYSILGRYESSADPLEAGGWWWVCADQGASPDPLTRGPFPNQNVIEDIVSLSTPFSFFTNADGWNLPVATMSGYTSPRQDVPWLAWQDSPDPLGG